MSRFARTSLVVAAAAIALASGCTDGDDDADAGSAEPAASASSTAGQTGQSGQSGQSGQPDDNTSAAPGADPSTTAEPGGPVPPSTTPPSLPPEVPVSVAVQPGTATDGFEGALSDIDDQGCERDGDQWVASGAVSNPLEVDASYRIYVAFLDPANETLGLVQVDVVDLAPGATQDWQAELALDDDDVRCILRVERVAAS